MRNICIVFFTFSAMFFFVTPTHAWLFHELRCPTNNPDIAACYTSGIHAIVGEQNDTHQGFDIVLKHGNNGNFDQWFAGDSNSEGREIEHSIWYVTESHTCPANWIPVPNAKGNGWGDYLKNGADYCVHTIDNNFFSNTFSEEYATTNSCNSREK